MLEHAREALAISCDGVGQTRAHGVAATFGIHADVANGLANRDATANRRSLVDRIVRVGIGAVELEGCDCPPGPQRDTLSEAAVLDGFECAHFRVVARCARGPRLREFGSRDVVMSERDLEVAAKDMRDFGILDDGEWREPTRDVSL